MRMQPSPARNEPSRAALSGSHETADASRPRPATARACGKAIIIGEHAVVYGARAIAMPVRDMSVSVRLEPRVGSHHAGPLMRFSLGGKPMSDHLVGVIADACDILGIAPFALDLEAQSSALIGAGLGSSASLCVVVLRALAQAIGRTLADHELAAFANQLERRFHGNPSGLDTAVVACERVIQFVKGEAPAPVTVRSPTADGRPWRFALLDTGVRSSTMAMIQIAASYFAGDVGKSRIAAFDDLAGQVLQGFAAGKPEPVACALQSAATHLAAAGVVNSEVAAAMAVAEAAGALAAKPTGAGGGGCVLALLAPHDEELQLAAMRARHGTARVYGVSLADFESDGAALADTETLS